MRLPSTASPPTTRLWSEVFTPGFTQQREASPTTPRLPQDSSPPHAHLTAPPRPAHRLRPPHGAGGNRRAGGPGPGPDTGRTALVYACSPVMQQYGRDTWSDLHRRLISPPARAWWRRPAAQGRGRATRGRLTLPNGTVREGQSAGKTCRACPTVRWCSNGYRTIPCHWPTTKHGAGSRPSPAPAARTTTAWPGRFLQPRPRGKQPLTTPCKDNPCCPHSRRGTFNAIQYVVTAIQKDRMCNEKKKGYSRPVAHERTNICLICALFAEIEAQFASEWVLVADPQTNNALEVQRGNVLYHSKTGMRSIVRPCGCGPDGLPCCIPGRSPGYRDCAMRPL